MPRWSRTGSHRDEQSAGLSPYQARARRALLAGGGVKPLERRLVRLEGAVTGVASRYMVRLPGEAIGDDEAVRAAIAEHRRSTGWMGPVILAPARMTQAEWVACFGAGGAP